MDDDVDGGREGGGMSRSAQIIDVERSIFEHFVIVWGSES